MTEIATGRIAGLDLVRSALIAAGLFVHAPTGLGDAPLFDAITLLSDGFRIGCLFALSGFIGAMTLQRRSPVRWFRTRLLQLGVPAAFGLLVLSPMIWAMVTLLPNGSQATPLPFAWHHFWFLIVLIAYTPVAVLIEMAERRWGMIARFDRSDRAVRTATGPLLLTVTIAATTLGLMLVGPIVTVVPTEYLAASGNGRLAGGYLAIYLLGILLAHAPRLRETLFGARAVSGTILVLGIGLCLMTITGAARDAEGYMHFAIAVACPPAAFALMLEFACRRRIASILSDRLGPACYTVYLLHLPIATGVNLLLSARAWDPYPTFMVSVFVSATASFLLHEYVVRRNPVAALIVNGRWPESWRSLRQQPQATRFS